MIRRVGGAVIGFLRAHYRPMLTILVVLIAWQYFGARKDPILFSTPTRISKAFVDLAESGDLYRESWRTTSTFLVGLGISMAVGVPLGLLSGRYRGIRDYTEVAVRILYATPTIALFPLFIVWFGVGNTFRLALVISAATFPIVINAQAGVRSVEQGLVEVATTFGAKEREIFTKIVVPATVPFIAAGFKLAIGRAIVITVGMEMLTSINGLGGMMASYGNQFRTDYYFAPLMVVIAISLLAFALGDWVERRFSRWRPQSGK